MYHDLRSKTSISVIFVFSFTAETESEAAASESKTQKEAIDLKDLIRVDRILKTLQKKVVLTSTCMCTECPS